MYSRYLSGNLKKSSAIIVLLIFMMLFNLNDYSLDFLANNQNPDQNLYFLNNVNFPKTSNSDYSSNSSGTGTDVNITLLQSYKNDTVLFMNSSKSNNLSAVVITPTNQMFNTTSSNISISQLNAYNNTYKIQEDQHSLTEQEIIENTAVASSFQVPSTCYFSEVIPYFNITTEGNLSIMISNSTWNATHERPDVGNYKSDVIFTEILTNTSQFSYMTFTTEQTLLDISNTDNNTFFVIFYVPEDNLGEFQWARAGVGNSIVNESFSYEKEGNNDWDYIPHDDEVNSSDFCFNYTISPLNSTPNPNQINLKVNQSDIQTWNNTENKGNWISDEIWNGGDSARLNFSFSCSWPNTTWNINNIEIQYALRTEKNQSKFFIPNSDSLVYWNVEYKAEQFNTSVFSDFKINYSVPISWNPIDAYRDDITNKVNFTYVIISESEKIVQIDIPSSFGNNTWFLNLTSTNLKSNIKLLKDGIETNSAYFEDIITLNVSFSEEISGDVYLEIFYPNGTILNNIQKETVNNNDYITFDPWNLSEDVGCNNGTYKIQVKWNNSLDKAILDEIYLEINENLNNPSSFNWIWIIPIIFAITIPILAYVLLKRKKIEIITPIGHIPDDFEKFKNLINDEQNIRMVFIIHKETSVLLSKKLYGLKDESAKSDLISGFLSALSGWGQEVNKSADADGLRLLVWNNFSILLSHGEYITTAIVSDSSIKSDEMKERINLLLKSFEDCYGEGIKDFSGKIKQFEEFAFEIDDTLKTYHQNVCKINYDELEKFEISKSIKKFFQNISYVQNDFFIIDLIQDITDQKLFKNSINAYKLLYDLLKDGIIYPDLT